MVVCRAQRGERGRGSGEAKPGARHASLFAVQFFAVQQNAERTYCTAYSQSLSSLVLFLAAVTATPVATLHSVVDAHGAQAILGKIKRTKEHQNNGNAGSFKFAAGQQWLQPTGCPIQHRVRNQPHREKLQRQPHRLRWRATSHSNSNYFRSYMETIKLT